MSQWRVSGIARAFPSGRAAYPEFQNEEETEEIFRENERGTKGKWKNWGNDLVLPTRELEMGYSHVMSTDSFTTKLTNDTTIFYKTVGTFCNKTFPARSTKSMLSRIVHCEWIRDVYTKIGWWVGRRGRMFRTWIFNNIWHFVHIHLDYEVIDG